MKTGLRASNQVVQLGIFCSEGMEIQICEHMQYLCQNVQQNIRSLERSVQHFSTFVYHVPEIVVKLQATSEGMVDFCRKISTIVLWSATWPIHKGIQIGLGRSTYHIQHLAHKLLLFYTFDIYCISEVKPSCRTLKDN